MIMRHYPIEIQFFPVLVILLALILPVWADDTEQGLDPVASAQTNEVVEQVLDPFVSEEVDEVVPQVRDPFWPVGYGSGNETATVAVALSEIKLEVAPEMKPVSQEEWDKARAKLPRAGGIFIGSHPISKEKVEKMMMSGKVYYAGDLLVQTNEFVAFTWKIDTISFKSTKYEISPVTAERVMKESK